MMRALNVDLDTGIAALGDFEPLAGRGAERTLIGARGPFTLIDESYNASPVSVAAALATLGARTTSARRIAALTDMLELGPESELRHAELAQAVEAARIDQVFCAGPLMKSLFEALPAARRGAWAATAEDLAPALADALGPDDVVMIKGSRDSRAAALVAELVARQPARTGEGNCG